MALIPEKIKQIESDAKTLVGGLWDSNYTIQLSPNDIRELATQYYRAGATVEAEKAAEEKKSILAAVARGDDLAFSLAFDGELSKEQKANAEIERLKGLLRREITCVTGYASHVIDLWHQYKIENNL